MTDKQRPFGVSMTEREFDECLHADEAAFRSPIPTQIVSNGEYNPMPQTEKQKQVEFLIKEIADTEAKRHNTTRRKFLASASGMAAAFQAMNMVHGDMFAVSAAEVKNPDAAGDRKAKYKGQFIFDDQTHFIRDDFKEEGLLGLTKWAEGANVNPNIGSVPTNLSRYKMDNYLKEIFLDSDTTLAILTGAPFDDPNWWLLSNDAIQNACRTVNKMAGSVRMLGHSIITPKYPNWMDEVDRSIAELKPVSWKSYTIGDPFGPSKYAWRLDDEKLMYPFYEKAIKSGINTICIHKGLMPRDYEKAFCRHLGKRHRRRRGQSRQRLAEDELCHLPRCLASVAGRQARHGNGPIRKEQLHPMVDRLGPYSGKVWREQRLRRNRLQLCQYRCHRPAFLRRLHRPIGQSDGP